jgi:hypothetical protein
VLSTSKYFVKASYRDSLSIWSATGGGQLIRISLSMTLTSMIRGPGKVYPQTLIRSSIGNLGNPLRALVSIAIIGFICVDT